MYIFSWFLLYFNKLFITFFFFNFYVRVPFWKPLLVIGGIIIIINIIIIIIIIIIINNNNVNEHSTCHSQVFIIPPLNKSHLTC